MQIARMAKKVAAISAGALMLGATLTGALAANLSAYPQPFVKNGVLDNTVIVVGKNAATSDVLGAIDIAAALQAEATSPVSGGDAVDPTITSGTKVAKAGNEMNYGEGIADIDSTFTGDDLDLLEDGTFMKEDFSQKIVFADNNAFDYEGAQKVDKVQFDAGNFLVFDDNADVYTYSWTLDNAVDFEEESDIETKTIDIQGNTYTISDVKLDTTAHTMTQMTLLAGETTRLLYVDEPLTVGDNTITVVSTNENEDRCLLNVNGKNVYVDVGDTETVGGLTLGVTAAFASHGGENDACEVNVGASEIQLNDGAEVKVNGAKIEGSSVVLDGTDADFTGLTITYKMDKDDFEEGKYANARLLAEGNAWVDPVFGNFKVDFAGTSGKFEDVAFDSAGTDGALTFKNLAGDDVNVEYWLDDTTENVTFGADEDTPLLYDGAQAAVDLDTVTPLLWVVLPGGEVHILEYDDYDADKNEISFTDLQTERTEKGTFSAVAGVVEAVTLTSLGNVNLGLTEATMNLEYNPSAEVAQTENGMEVGLADNGDGTLVATLTSLAEDSDVQGVDDNAWDVTIREDGSTDPEIEISAPDPVDAPSAFLATADGVKAKYGDNDVLRYVSAKGIVFEHDNDEGTYLDVKYPEEDVYANVFVAPTTAQVVGGSSGGDAVKVNPFAVGLAVLDEDAKGLSKNMIVVGGPCANDVSFDLLAPTGECGAGFEAGKATLKMFDRSGKAALLVAGYDAQDTLNAAYVLAQHDTTYATQFATLGSEVELVVTDMSKVVFNTV